MDSLSFIAELVKALAWPITILVIFLLLRRQIIELIPTLQRFRYRDLEIDFQQQVRELAAWARGQLSGVTIPAEQNDQRGRWRELAEHSPRAVVLESWLQLEKSAVEAIRRRGVHLTSREEKTPVLLGEALETAGLLNDETAAIFHRLRNLRNAAAHASDYSFNADAAMEYADLALRLCEHLNRA